MSLCEHPVGYVPHELVTAHDWNNRLAALIADIEQTKVHSQPDPSGVASGVLEFNCCPYCGVKLDRVALGLMTYAEAYLINSLRGDTE